MTDLTEEEIKEQKLKELAEDQERYYKDQVKKGAVHEYQKGSKIDFSINGNGKAFHKKKKKKHQSGKAIKKLLKISKTNTNTENNVETDDENEEDESKEDVKEFFFKFAESHIPLLFKDQFGKLFAHVMINDINYDLMLLTSNKFDKYIYKIFYETETKFVLRKEFRKEIIEHLQYKAEFSGITKKLDLRVAKTVDDDYTFYYDLTNNNEGITAIKITPEGWSYENNPPILFRRFANQLPQVNPSLYIIDNKDDKIFDKFLDLLNVKDDDNKLLLKCYIVSLFIPVIAKPILMLHGEQGSAKSTLQELIKMLVDPSSIRTLIFPRDINELVQKLSHNYIAYFDNVSSIKEWITTF
jgi:hypothetical protein